MMLSAGLVLGFLALAMAENHVRAQVSTDETNSEFDRNSIPTVDDSDSDRVISTNDFWDKAIDILNIPTLKDNTLWAILFIVIMAALIGGQLVAIVAGARRKKKCDILIAVGSLLLVIALLVAAFYIVTAIMYIRKGRHMS
ncbi:hypothetical protein BgAZ_300040 [Babesia gibsoni]|uniref:Uncharacterized protein n=1 Tax=Babesia gibsoni TaxID=33632 RepID=A0AAD8PDQ6_BABGI|nr:hypothetical protein BgAZ_300040 [Babesia gibsoni]